MTHDYKRHGTTTLFAALNVLDGTVIGQNMQRHRHQEFIRFLNRIERETPADKDIHVILDNYAAHKKDKVRAWLARHPRWTFHFTPTSCSWLNAVEGFFAKLTRRRLRHGVFHAVLTPREGTASNIDNDALVFSQPNGSVAITETGALRLIATVPAPDEGLPVIIEEDVRDIISRFLHFSDAVLTFVDPVSRLSHVVVAAKLLDEGHLAWRTRAEHSRSPNSVSMGGYGDGEHEPVHLSPPHRTRSALRQMESELVDDLMVKLRRQLQNPRREPW